MPGDTISEQDFLLTELRYTLGQLHVQVGDLLPEQRSNSEGGQSVDQILQEMMQTEEQYQKRYAQLLHAAVPDHGIDLLPASESPFEDQRGRTIALLEHSQGTWSQELLDMVKQQVAGDRAYTTRIANRRKEIFGHDQRPDLNEPLTASH